MSVLIKGMQMPSVCDCCWALDESGDYPMCRMTGETRGYNFRVREKRMDRCPLIELPDHGDLIDRDVLLSKVQKWYWEALETVKRMPTVIPAERSE